MTKYIREIIIWILAWFIGSFLKLSAANAAALATVITAIIWVAFIGIKYFENLEQWQKSVNEHMKQSGETVSPTFAQSNNQNVNNNVAINLNDFSSVKTSSDSISSPPIKSSN